MGNFFYSESLETVGLPVMVFRSAKTGATTVEYNECLETISIVLVSSAECKRGLSALNDVCTKERNRICARALAMLLLSM